MNIYHHPAGDALLNLVDLRMWCCKSVVPSTDGGSSEIKIDGKCKGLSLFGSIWTNLQV